MTDESGTDEGDMREAEPVDEVADATADAPKAEVVAPMPRESVAQQHNRLRDAMRRARLNEAERRDVIESLREGEVARLEMLQDALADVFESVPEESDLFDGAILPGNPPRLWVDVLAYVSMARDRRTYQFVQEARYGRRTIYETTNFEDMSKRVTDYVASRVLERERALVSDELALIERREAMDEPHEDIAPDASGAIAGEKPEAEDEPVNIAAANDTVVETGNDSGNAVGLRIFVAFLLGMAVGAVALFVYGANYTPS
ncbi:MAG: hypothetical protein R3D43_02655 [Tepidamorphaceae bacterium]